MVADSVPRQASSDSLVQSQWLRLVLRAALAALAFWMLYVAVERFDVFLKESAGSFRFDDSTWLTWLGATMAAGFLFGLATSLPFEKLRYFQKTISFLVAY